VHLPQFPNNLGLQIYIAMKRAPKPISAAQERPIWILGELLLAGTGASLGAASSSDNGDSEISASGEISDEGVVSDEGAICFLDGAGAFASGVSDSDGDDGAFVDAGVSGADGAFAFGVEDEAGDGDDCPSIPGAIIGLTTWRMEIL